MDNLEKFIRENRNEFDSQIPPRRVWDTVHKQIRIDEDRRTGGKVVQLKVSFLWKAAATVLFLLSAGFLWLNNLNSDQASQEYALSQELDEIEQYYSLDFNNRIAQFTSNEAYQNVAPDLEQIDQVIAELKLELKSVPEDRKEQVVHGIIQNYRIKIQILEKVLERQDSENLINQKNEVYEI